MRWLVQLAVVIGVAVTGCSDASPAEVSVGDVPAVGSRIDERGGYIHLPLEQIGPSVEERHIVEFAAAVAQRRCLRSKGFTMPAVDRRDEVEPPSLRYGVWHRPTVKDYGYGLPPESRAAQRLSRFNRHQRTQKELSALRRCAAAEHLSLREPLPAELAAYELYERAIASRNARQLIDTWRQCLKSHGVPPPGSQSSWIPGGRNFDLSKQVAMTDVRCKERVGLVPGLVSIEARLQRGWISRHPDVVQQESAFVQETVFRAEDFLEKLK